MRTGGAITHAAALFGVAVLSVLVLSCASQQPPRVRPDWRAEQEIWWTDSGLVKRALVEHLRLQDRHPQLKDEHDAYWSIASLVLLLDGRSDPLTLQTLADLTSYYWGESGGEVFQCVVLRKGKAIVPFLQRSLDAPENDCHEALGENGSGCLQETEYRKGLRALLNAIARDERCAIER